MNANMNSRNIVQVNYTKSFHHTSTHPSINQAPFDDCVTTFSASRFPAQETRSQASRGQPLQVKLTRSLLHLKHRHPCWPATFSTPASLSKHFKTPVASFLYRRSTLDRRWQACAYSFQFVRLNTHIVAMVP